MKKRVFGKSYIKNTLAVGWWAGGGNWCLGECHTECKSSYNRGYASKVSKTTH